MMMRVVSAVAPIFVSLMLQAEAASGVSILAVSPLDTPWQWHNYHSDRSLDDFYFLHQIFTF